jgi:hypothetical protein
MTGPGVAGSVLVRGDFRSGCAAQRLEAAALLDQQPSTTIIQFHPEKSGGIRVTLGEEMGGTILIFRLKSVT